jgi:hypothetical protein
VTEETSEVETPAKADRGRAGLFGIAFLLIVLSAAVLGMSGLTRSLSAGLSLASIALSVAAAALAVLALRASRG